MALTSEAKRLLAETIRGTEQDPTKGLRHRLLEAIQSEAAGRYRLSVSLKDAGLDEAHRRRRERLEAYLDEKTRATKPKNASEGAKTRERLLREAEKEAAATLLNRLVTLKLLEARGLSRPPVVTGGWNSKGYREFREFAPALIDDATEGYAFLLQLLFDDLATDLPGLFGDVGVTRLLPTPAKALRDVVEALDNPDLVSAWADDVTLGWVYQYWNDPDREALDAKIKRKQMILPHEIASKTQMFTERYMVEWLLQNSLGLMWLAMCRKHGWTADVERVLPLLDARRAEWRRKREAGEVSLDALMPIEGELEEHWKYYVPQPIPDDAVEKAPESVRALKILDPACGSGHFLVIAFDLLAALYHEEARHLGTTVTDRQIAESILENNLHGIDIDSRAIQIAAAGLHLKARSLAKAARPKRLNLVAPVLQLANLPSDDPAVVLLRRDLKREVGIPEELTTKLLSALAGVDYLGSLLKVDAAVEDAIKNVELEFEQARGQGDFFKGFPAQQVKLSVGEAKATILDKLEQFLAAHSQSEDLGLRLDGEQLATGVRFLRIAKEGAYHIVNGNPPYQALSKTASFGYVTKTYPRAKADLYAAFLERGLQFTAIGGVSALLTMRGWMFLGKGALRKSLVREFDLRLLGDVDRGAFEDVPDEVLATVMSVFFRSPPGKALSIAVQPTSPQDHSRDAMRTARKRSALLAQVGRYEFVASSFSVIDAEPLVYWWSADFLKRYADAQKLGEVSPGRAAQSTGNNLRFIRRPWEVAPIHYPRTSSDEHSAAALFCLRWAPFMPGAEGEVWFEPLREVLNWRSKGLEIKLLKSKQTSREAHVLASEDYFFGRGVAFSMIGSQFLARAHRYRSVLGDKGSSLYPSDVPMTVCQMNRDDACIAMESLNPSISFQVGDVNRLPLFVVECADEIWERLEATFHAHELGREASVEFSRPHSSSWSLAKRWAKSAVQRPPGASLPPWIEPAAEVEPAAQLSFAIGVALGRFGPGGEGILDEPPSAAFQAGIMFLSSEGNDSLDDVASDPITEAWRAHGAALGKGDDLRMYLRKSFFSHHKKIYEGRPIYVPLSSSKKNFVAFVSIHRWRDNTLTILLAEHLMPTKRRLEGELEDLRAARASGDNKARAEKRFVDVQKSLEDMNEFIAKVTEIAERGPPPPLAEATQRREVDGRFVMDLDDGVMVNSSGLWPLLEPLWPEPRKWWTQLANERGPKGTHFDWSHMAARYFPARVRRKCFDEPSLAVAHRCFWELHPAKAYAWELSLQDEIRSDFTIDEPGSDVARKMFLVEHAGQAKEILAAEMRRREGKAAKADDQLELAGEAEDDDDGEAPDE